MSKKIILTSFAALEAKYGEGGTARIRNALSAVISADSLRGLETTIIDLSDPREMKKVGGRAAVDPKDPKSFKEAVDSAYRHRVPDYILLLGAPDIIPHIDLVNPAPDDGDPLSPGDLPYACEAPYSTRAADFIGPSRVVGRLPDIAGVKDPGYLLGLLDVAANWKSRDAGEFRHYLGISAAVWKGSTALSLENTFGPGAEANLVPPKDREWPPSTLAAPMHFINCHGASVDPRYFGQLGYSYPVAHDAAWISGKLAEGTVASVECCYGAQLYDPAPLHSRQAGIANTYLGNRAYAFFGSTTIAYGPAEGNGSADLICQYFLQRVLKGTSVGRAALEARQQFAQGAASLDPYDLKTLAQMNLLGDPSIHPVKRSAPRGLMSPKNVKGAAEGMDDVLAARAERRRQLFTRGLSIIRTQASAGAEKKGKLSSSLETAIRRLAEESGIGRAPVHTYEISRPAMPRAPGAKGLAAVSGLIQRESRYHVAVGKRQENEMTQPQYTAPS
jgi:hypothetical protein